MNRQTRLLIVIGIAVVVAGVASFVMYRVGEANTRLIELVVARRPLVAGVTLTEEDVQTIPWSQDAPVAGSKASPKDVVGRCLRVAVSQTDPITESKLAPAKSGCGLAAAIEPGMLAMSVKVNEVVGVAGFVVPGTHVDVILTLRSQRGESSSSRVVVRNVQVLAAGSSYDEDAATKDGKPISTGVVTLMVAQVDAQKIALAGNEGVITLALRNPADTLEGLLNATTLPDLLSGQPIALPTPTPSRGPAPVAAPARLTVRVASPKSGSALNGAADLAASVSGVTGGVAAQWKIDGVDFGPELTEPPFSVRWDTTRLSNGPHSVMIAVRDGTGKTATSTVMAMVSQPCETFKSGERKVVPCPQQ